MAKFNKDNNKDDKILSTPSVKSASATSESSNLTIESDHIGTDDDSFFLDFGDGSDDKTHREKTMNLRLDTDNNK